MQNSSQVTSTQHLTGHMPFLSSNQQCQNTEWKKPTLFCTNCYLLQFKEDRGKAPVSSQEISYCIQMIDSGLEPWSKR